MTLETMSVMGT